MYVTSVHALGFPDGHVTERETAQRILACLFIAASLAFALTFGALAVARTVRPRWIEVLCAAYVLVAAGAWLVDQQLIRTLPGGAGG